MDKEKIILDLIKRVELLESYIFGEKLSEVEFEEKEKVYKKSKKKQSSEIVIPHRLENLSHSEIIEILRYSNIKMDGVSQSDVALYTRQIPKEDAIDIIKRGTHKEDTLLDPLKEIREKIFSFINRNEILRSSLDCSTHCPTCPYTKVINCISVNRRLIENETIAIKPQHN